MRRRRHNTQRRLKLSEIDFARTVKNHASMLKYMLKFAPAAIISQMLFCIFVSFADTMSGPVTLKFVFNGLSEGKSFPEIFKFIILISMIILARHAFGGLNEYFMSMGRVKISSGMRRTVFEKAKSIDLSCYETAEFYNDFVWAASQADDKIFRVMHLWSLLFARVSDIVFIGGFMLINDYTLFAFSVVSMIVRVICSTKIINKRYEMEVEAKPVLRELDYTTRVFYLADYAKEIRLSDMHKTLFKNLKKTMTRLRDIYMHRGKKIALYSIISDCIASDLFTAATLFYLCMRTMVYHTMLFGDLSALLSATTGFSFRMGEFINVLANFAQESLYIDKFMSFMNTESKTELRKGRIPESGVKEIELRGVSFKYTGEEHCSLSDINIKIKPYEKIALVGYNGAGKSTLAKLLMNLYDVSEGSILVGGIDIREFDVSEYRKQFGAVFQDYKIFAGTVGENVMMDFAQEKDHERIISSLHDSGFDKIDRLSDGVNTSVTREFNADGLGLSGGEEQKIAIARIFCKDCEYVILDEPSSALDPISEYNLNQSMMKLSENKTVIFISHRLSTTCMADRIYMLEQGKIIEQGSHDELMSLDGKYAEMFNKQAEKYRM
ncbi:MAG: ABC transporter ATP-binding protein [Oscillospiraceae bacterium]|nr:ABC transporter ATP-binding protein [Oscillospiraceae bacterium]